MIKKYFTIMGFSLLICGCAQNMPINALDSQFNAGRDAILAECFQKLEKKVYKNSIESSKKCVGPKITALNKRIYTPENILQQQQIEIQQQQLEIMRLNYIMK